MPEPEVMVDRLVVSSVGAADTLSDSMSAATKLVRCILEMVLRKQREIVLLFFM